MQVDEQFEKPKRKTIIKKNYEIMKNNSDNAAIALFIVLIASVISCILLFTETIKSKGFGLFTFILLILFIILVINNFIVSSRETKNINETYKIKANVVLKNLSNFKADDVLLSNISGMSIAFDHQRKKVCFIDAICKPWVYEYMKVIQSEIVVDGQTITKQSGTIGRSIVGGVLAGGAGAIIGGTTGSTISNEKINSILVKITINDTINPVFKIIFLNVPTEKRSPAYDISFSTAERLHGIIAGIIKQADLDMSKTSNKSLTISDELVKLKKLLDDGVLTGEEFNNQKKKLLELK